MITCTTEVKFCAGHRVVGHEGGCKNLHGHNYSVQITAERVDTRQDLLPIGYVIDFKILRVGFKRWIDANWDHAMVLWDKDPVAVEIASMHSAEEHGINKDLRMRVGLMPYNPTAENMARYLGEEVLPKLFVPQDVGFVIFKVVVIETENSFATWELNIGLSELKSTVKSLEEVESCSL